MPAAIEGWQIKSNQNANQKKKKKKKIVEEKWRIFMKMSALFLDKVVLDKVFIFGNWRRSQIWRR